MPPWIYYLCKDKKKNGDTLIVCLYVDDLFFTGNNPMFEDFKQAMTKEFEMTNIDFMS